jgi:hypothetical protein
MSTIVLSNKAAKLMKLCDARTHPTSAVLSDAWYFAKRVTLSLDRSFHA